MGDRTNETTTAGHSALPPQPDGAAPARVCLVFYHGEGVVAAELRPGQTLVVGRSSGCDVQIDLKLLSRRHAQFAREDDAIELQDLGSRNGTFVDAMRVQRAQLRSNS